MIDPDQRTTALPIADHAVAWACVCGHVSWLHHEHCDRCGTARPAPVANAEPSHTPRVEHLLSSDPAFNAVDSRDWDDPARMAEAVSYIPPPKPNLERINRTLRLMTRYRQHG